MSPLSRQKLSPSEAFARYGQRTRRDKHGSQHHPCRKRAALLRGAEQARFSELQPDGHEFKRYGNMGNMWQVQNSWKRGGCILLQKKIRHQSKLTERLKARRPNFMLKSKVEIHYSKLYQNSLSGLSFTPWIFPKCMYLHLYFRFRFLYFSYFLCYGLYYLWRS